LTKPSGQKTISSFAKQGATDKVSPANCQLAEPPLHPGPHSSISHMQFGSIDKNLLQNSREHSEQRMQVHEGSWHNAQIGCARVASKFDALTIELLEL